MDRLKGDERILGNSDFVEDVLRRAEEEFEHRYQLQVSGYGLEEIAGEVATLLEIEPEKIFAPGKYPLNVQARSLFCYWAVRKLGMTTTALAKTFNQTQPAVSIAVRRGEKIAAEKGYTLPGK